ncbi:MAG: dTDP-4-dehydrorhamnose 3,5-epimerase family protein, partial [Propionicimonas sp.]
MSDLALHPTAIDGLLVLDLPLHGDARGWFKENWQREKMTALGLPDFGPVQNNMSFNSDAGVTRGFHAEPWDKLVSLAAGRIFGAWVDL